MAHAIQIHAHGGPDVTRWEDVPVPAPGPGEARIRQRAIGVNFIDVYQRTGLYPLSLPAVLTLLLAVKVLGLHALHQESISARGVSLGALVAKELVAVRSPAELLQALPFLWRSLFVKIAIPMPVVIRDCRRAN